MTPLEISGHEIVLILAASVMLYVALAMCERRPIRNGLLVLCLAPALFVAVEGGPELLTYDEVYMIKEITNFNDVTSQQWGYGNYHTSIALTGNIVNALRTPLAKNSSQLKMLAKSVHWLLGIACLAGIFWTISKRWISKNLFAEYSLVYFYSALLLPTNILSLKVANYDMLAMFLGIWGLLCCLVGCEKVKQLPPLAPNSQVKPARPWRALLSETLWPDGGWTFFGVILTTLAAQEKQIATPVLSLALVLSLLMRLRRRGRIDWWMAVQAVVCLITVALVVSLTYGAVAIWHPPEFPAFSLSFAWNSLLTHFDIAMQWIGVSSPTALADGGVALASVALAALAIWWLRTVQDKFGIAIKFAFLLLLIAALTVGVLSFYKIQAYVDPFRPIPKGNYVPPDWNSEYVHYFDRTRLGYILHRTGSAYSAVAISLPSVFVVIAICALGALILRRRSLGKGTLLGFAAIGIVSLVMPLVYVLTNTPVGARYLDIWIFLPVLLLVILGCRLLRFIALPRNRMLAAVAFCLLLALEVLPFRPVVAAFWPWWANASALPAAREKMDPGTLLPVWAGWGEEAMIAGRQLRRMARAGQLPSKSFRLFVIYQGEWLQPDESNVTYVVSRAPYLSFTENDYYIINRAAVVLGIFGYITDKKPVWTLKYRGVAQAWLYRGSDLKDGN